MLNPSQECAIQTPLIQACTSAVKLGSNKRLRDSRQACEKTRLKRLKSALLVQIKTEIVERREVYQGAKDLIAHNAQSEVRSVKEIK